MHLQDLPPATALISKCTSHCTFILTFGVSLPLPNLHLMFVNIHLSLIVFPFTFRDIILLSLFLRVWFTAPLRAWPKTAESVQLSSHSCPSEIRDELLRCGRTKACFALDDSSGAMFNVPCSVDSIDLLLGRVTEIEVFAWVLARQCLSCGLR